MNVSECEPFLVAVAFFGRGGVVLRLVGSVSSLGLRKRRHSTINDPKHSIWDRPRPRRRFHWSSLVSYWLRGVAGHTGAFPNGDATNFRGGALAFCPITPPAHPTNQNPNKSSKCIKKSKIFYNMLFYNILYHIITFVICRWAIVEETNFNSQVSKIIIYDTKVCE